MKIELFYQRIKFRLHDEDELWVVVIEILVDPFYNVSWFFPRPEIITKISIGFFSSSNI
jgi:hypothetical protein